MRYAQIDGAGVVFAILDTASEIDRQDMIEIGHGENPLGMRRNGSVWETVEETEAERAARDLAEVDAATGMSRTMRETLVAIAGDKAPAYLLSQEAKAVAARERLKK